MFTEKRKADRAKMAAAVAALVGQFDGATCEIRDCATHIWPDGSRPLPEHRHRLVCSIAYQGARVGIDFDGGRGNSQPDTFCMAWHIDLDSDRRFSERFGSAVGASVNPCHFSKCTGFARGWDSLEFRLLCALNCIERGEAFDAERERRAIERDGTAADRSARFAQWRDELAAAAA